MKDIIVLDYMKHIATRAIASVQSGNAATISGREGEGVRILLKYIEGIWKQEHEGKTLFLTMCSKVSAFKALQYFASTVLGDSMPRNWKLHNACELVHLIANHLEKQKVGLILVDKADAVSGEFIDHVMTVTTLCSDLGWNVGVVLGLKKNPKEQMEFFDDFSSTSVAFDSKILPLTPSETTCVLCELTPHFADICERINNQEGEANKLVHLIHKLSGGNFRRLAEFTDYLTHWPPKEKIGSDNLEALWNSAFSFN
jgi:hypothetical protein